MGERGNSQNWKDAENQVGFDSSRTIETLEWKRRVSLKVWHWTFFEIMKVMSGVYLQRALAWVRIRGQDINARRLHFIECVHQHPSGFQSRLGIAIDHLLKHPAIGSKQSWRQVAKEQGRFYSWDLHQLRQLGILHRQSPFRSKRGGV